MSRKDGESSEEKPAKRPRLGALKQDSDVAAAVTFDELKNDCLVHILSFLKTEEINDATLINSAFREARNDSSLDQTRTATIIVKTKNISVLDFFRTVEDKGWTSFFSEGSNYKCLKIIGIRGLRSGYSFHRSTYESLQTSLFEQNIGRLSFQSITSLDLSPTLSADQGVEVIHSEAIAIAAIVQVSRNLQQVDLSYVNTNGELVMMDMVKQNPNLKIFKCNGCNGVYFGPTSMYSQNANNVREIQLDGASISALISSYPGNVRELIYAADLSDTETFLFKQYHRLERISMKNATWRPGLENEARPVHQNMLIKLVRYHPTLRWLRSDLTDENIVMLNRERPEVTLVNK